MSASQAEIFAEYLETIAPEHREAEALAALRDLLPGVETLGQAEAQLQHDWSWWGRPEQIWRPGSELYTVYCAGRGFGKLLSLDVLIPTVQGWKRNGDLEVGDLVFGPDGQPTRIVEVFDRVPERAWRLTFSDGTTLDAGGEHLWCTWTHRDRKAWNRGQGRTGPLPDRWWDWSKRSNGGAVGPVVRDTDEIVRTLIQGKRGDRNHSIPTCEPLALPVAQLPLDPWVLGYWLGNGTSSGSSLTCHHDDVEPVLAALLARGLDASLGKAQPGKAPTVLVRGVLVILRALGVLGNKHVPEAYLWASAEQRLALLRGLLDSDGYAEESKVEFCSTTRVLADAVLHLARSLGERPSLYEGRATLNGRDMGPKWRVCWRPARSNPFALSRKGAKVCMEHGAQASRLFHRMIVAAEPIAPEPMRCIEIDHPSHLYLAGEGMIPTHNTLTGAHATNYVGLHPELCGGRPAEGPDDWRAGEFNGRMAIAGRTANEVNTEMIDGDAGIMAVCDPALRPTWNKSDKLLTWPTGVVCKVMSADVPVSFRGPNLGFFWWDEWAHARRLKKGWEQVRRTHRLASPGHHPRAVITTTPLGLPELLELVWECQEGQPVKPGPDTPPERIFQGYVQNRLARCVGGSSYDNVSNLATEYLRDVVGAFEGTDDGPQENHGIIRLGVPGSPFKLEWIRRCEADEVPRLDRIAVFVDPTVSEHEKPPTADEPCECGIVAAGFEAKRRRMYALEDGSLTAAPHVWAERVVDLVLRHRATEIVAEDNNGGALLKIVLAQALRARRAEIDWTVKITLCTARADKLGRAVLAAPCWQQGKVWHVGSPRQWIALESQLVQLDPNRPIKGQRTDRLDAVVWGALTFFGDGTDQTKPWPLDGAERWAQIVAQVTASRGQASLPRRR